MSRLFILLMLCSPLLLTACAGGTDANIPGPALPVILAQPADQSVIEGSTASFSAGAAGSGTLSYQWQSSPDGATWTNIAGATAANYTTGAVTAPMNGTRYRAVITNALGSVTTSAVRLAVTPAVVAPQITVAPASQVVTAPATATFSVTASGTSPAYQWQISNDGGATFNAIGGATSATLALTSTTPMQSGSFYRVVVSNTAGTVTSATALLTVNPTPAAPVITAQPVSRTITAGSNVDFIVAAAGIPAPTYQWRNAGANLANGAISSGACSGATVTGATTATLTLTSVPIGCSGTTYSVVVGNGVAPDATSIAAALTVNAAPVAPTITANPGIEVVVTAGATAMFTAAASGVPTPTQQWQLSTDGGASWANITGATSSTYTTPATVVGDEGRRYRLVATNSQGSATSTAGVLYVYSAPSISSPADAGVIAGQTATFTVTVTGGQGAALLQWQRAEAGTSSFVDIAGATGASHTTPATVAGDHNARYRVRWSNASNDLAPAAITNSGTTAAAVLSVQNALTATQIVAGNEWSLVLRPDRTVWGWGQFHRNNGTVQYSNLAPGDAQLRPQQMYPAVLTDIRQIAGIEASFWAIKGAPGTTQSRLLAWGQSQYGQDGRGVDGNGTPGNSGTWGAARSNEATPVEALLGVGQPVDRLCSIAAGVQGVLIIRAVDDGGATTDCSPGSAKTVWHIGSLTQFGSQSTGLVFRMPGLPTNSPPATVFAGQTNSGAPPVAIALEDGRAYVLGENPFNGLGLALPAASFAGGAGGPVQLPAGWGAVRSFASSFYYSLFVVRTDGTVRTSGYNGRDEMGIGDTADGFRVDGPVDVLAETCTATPCASVLTGIESVVSNNSQVTLALRNGQIYGWGSPANGLLGSGYAPGQTQPFARQLPFGLNQVTAISSAYNHALAIGPGSAVYVWGSGLRGALGNGVDGGTRDAPQLVTLP